MANPILGIIGGGQLGSMLAQAASKIKIKTVIFSDDLESPAKNFADIFIFGKYDNEKKIEEFINQVDIVTLEFENIPYQTLNKIKKSKTIEVVLRKIATGRHKFASRGDDSGTNIRELALWSFSRINPQNFSGQWYLEMGSGMGATLNAGIELRAYVLTDRATWTTFKNKQNYEILFEGDNKLFNQYGAITINPAICPDVKASEANKIIDWLVSRKGQSLIGELRIDGQQLFFPGN